jgi:hypothetical protein
MVGHHLPVDIQLSVSLRILNPVLLISPSVFVDCIKAERYLGLEDCHARICNHISGLFYGMWSSAVDDPAVSEHFAAYWKIVNLAELFSVHSKVLAALASTRSPSSP